MKMKMKRNKLSGRRKPKLYTWVTPSYTTTHITKYETYV